MQIDIRFVSFLNTHLAVIALIAPWYYIDVLNTRVELNIFQLLKINEGDDDLGKPRATAGFLVISFLLSVITHLILVFNDWLNILNQKVNIYALLVSAIGQVFSSIVSFSIWSNYATKFHLGSLDIDLSTTYVGFVFSILHMLLSLAISVIVITTYIM